MNIVAGEDYVIILNEDDEILRIEYDDKQVLIKFPSSKNSFKMECFDDETRSLLDNLINLIKENYNHCTLENNRSYDYSCTYIKNDCLILISNEIDILCIKESESKFYICKIKNRNYGLDNGVFTIKKSSSPDLYDVFKKWSKNLMMNYIEKDQKLYFNKPTNLRDRARI